MEKAKKTGLIGQDDIKSIGVSINLAVANNKATGQGPVVEGLKGENVKVMENLDTELQKEFNLPVLVLNDGKAAAIQNTVDMGLPNTLSLAGGTGLAMGYGTVDFLTEGGNIIIDMSKNALGHSFSKVPGAAQQYLSQRKAFILAEQKGLDLSRFSTEKEKFQYLQDAFEGKSFTDPKDQEKAKEIFDEYPVYLVDFIQTVAAIVPVKNVTLTGRIALGEAGKHVLQKAQELIRRRNLDVNLQFPTVPEVNRDLGEKYLEIGQAVGATYYAAYKHDTMDMAMKTAKEKVGGIDLNQINVNRTGKSINIPFDPAQLNELIQGGFNGFTPVIINIAPIPSLLSFLRGNPAKESESTLRDG